MATFYLDPENGNDANDGTTFANRWKTLTSGATAARTAPGDTIRIIASPEPTSLGSAQWTDNSTTVTPTTATNKVIEECDAAWTGSANVTATASSSSHKTGTAKANFVIAGAFTTGKVAYKTLSGATDFSAYQQISFWFQSSVTTAIFDVKLCSDTIGDVAVDTLSVSLSALVPAGRWCAIVIDKGSALSAGINSIAVYAPVDPGSATWMFDNIVACKAPGSATEVTHVTLIGKNTGGEPEWYTINQLTDTDIIIGGSSEQLASIDPARPYRGTTESVTTYARKCLVGWNVTAASQNTLNESGTTGNQITYSGGWNRTDMSTQTGQSWFSGYHRNVAFVAAVSSISYITLTNIGIAHYGTTGVGEANNGWDISLLGILGCIQPFAQDASTALSQVKIVINQVWGHNNTLTMFSAAAGSLEITRIHGYTDTAVNGAAFSPALYTEGMHEYRISKIDNNATSGVNLIAGVKKIRLKGTTFQNNATSDVNFNDTTDGEVLIDNGQLLSSTPVTYGSTGAQYTLVRETNINNVSTAHKLTYRNGTVLTQNTTVHSTGVAWKASPTSANYTSTFPFRFPLASIAVNANKLVTIKCFIRRDNTELSAGLYFLKNALPGISETTVLMTAAADTWEEVTITGTPTSAGVLTVFGACYGGTTRSAFFDDMTITQAN